MLKTLKQKKTIFNLFLLIFSFIILSLNVFAFGVSTPYWENNQLIMTPGETKDIQFTLQNMVGNEDVTMKVELLRGSEIATLLDKNLEYLVPIKTKDTKVNIRIKIPENAPINKEYTVTLSFKTISKTHEGMVQMAGGMEKSFKVLVKLPEVEEEIKIRLSKGTQTLFAVILIIIIVFIYLAYKKIHKSKKHKK